MEDDAPNPPPPLLPPPLGADCFCRCACAPPLPPPPPPPPPPCTACLPAAEEELDGALTPNMAAMS